MTNNDERPRLGDYEVHRAWEGFASVRQVSSGEIMHSRTAPMEEARKLYVEQAHLAERLREDTGPLVLWDVGLGAAANAMAAIQGYETAAASSPVQPLEIISFENDLDSLRLAVSHPQDFPYLVHDAPAAILTEGHWESNRAPGLSWKVIAGDFVQTLRAAAPPDLIFYDMFSTKTSSEVWSFATFRELYQVCAGRAVELFTYTCSTANRAALLAAGFHVGRGRAAGPKTETTIALTREALSKRRFEIQLLGSDWLQKWNRSAAKFPHDLLPAGRFAFEKLIREHQQFRNSAAVERLSSTTPIST